MLKRYWKAYYNNVVVNRPPRKTILMSELDALKNTPSDKVSSPKARASLTALAVLDRPSIAVDLGCGDGRDTVEILRQNWAVMAIDKEPDAITLLARRDLNTLQLTTQIISFEELQLPRSVNLINASFSLPFCSPEAFASLWNKIFNALIPKSRFSGHLFGDKPALKDTASYNGIPSE